MNNQKLKAESDGTIVPVIEKPKAPIHAIHDDTLPEPLQFQGEWNGPWFDSKSKLLEYTDRKGFYVKSESERERDKVAEPKIPKKWTMDDLLEAERQAIWGMRPPNDFTDEIRETQRLIQWGMSPASEKEKETWKREERIYQSYKTRMKKGS